MRRRADLDRAKGLAIILVVFGHLVAREGPAGVGWYEPLRMAVYLFHMPFFLYLSGYVAALTGAAMTPPAGWAGLARRRAARLLGPFLGFGLLILAGKLALGPLARVDNPPAGFVEGLVGLAWATGRSPATSVWYLFALFVFSVATPVVWRRGGAAGLVAVAAVLFVLPAPPLLYLDRVCGYFLFFVAGVLAGSRAAAWERVMDRGWAGAAAVFAVVLICASLGWPAGTAAKLWLLAAGLLGMPALHGLTRAMPSDAMLWLGQWSFAIYLLNTICIGLAKAGLLTVWAWDGAAFLPFAAVLMLAGLFGPVALGVAARSIARRAGGWSPVPRVSAGSR